MQYESWVFDAAVCNTNTSIKMYGENTLMAIFNGPCVVEIGENSKNYQTFQSEFSRFSGTLICSRSCCWYYFKTCCCQLLDDDDDI
jgi:hypothetical protein